MSLPGLATHAHWPRGGLLQGRLAMRFVNSTDESLLAYYESVRKQVATDSRIGGPYRLIGERAKQYAQELQAEMRRRELRFTPIEWPH